MPRTPQLSKEERLYRKRERDRIRRAKIQNDEEARKKRNKQAAEAKRIRRSNIELKQIERERNKLLRRESRKNEAKRVLERERDTAARRKRRENEIVRSLERERDANAKRLRRLDDEELERLLKEEIELETISNERKIQLEREIARRMQRTQGEFQPDVNGIRSATIDVYKISAFGFDAQETENPLRIKTEPSDTDSNSIYGNDVLSDTDEAQRENILEPLVTILLPTIKSENLLDENEDPLET